MRLKADDVYRLVSLRFCRDLKLEKQRGLDRLQGLTLEGSIQPEKARIWVRTDLELVFQGIPKCGSTSMTNYFRMLRRNGSYRPRKPIRRVHQLSRSQFASARHFTKFVLVRNPYYRVLSAFVEKNGRPGFDHFPGLIDLSPGGFATFLRYLASDGLHEDKHWAPIVNQLPWPIEEFDYVLHLENLTAEFAEMLHAENLWLPSKKGVTEQHRVDKLRPGKLTASRDLATRFYTPALAELVAQLYREDFVLLGYSLEMVDASHESF